MARRNNDAEAFATVIVLVIIWVLYNIFLQLNLFYRAHPILFPCLALLALVWGGTLFYFLISFINRLRNEKWSAIERIEDMQKLHWREFEEFIEFVLQKNGFKTKLGTGTKDGWVDIEANLDGRKYLVQCKKWDKYKISEPNIREFLWAISDFDIDAKWIYVTTSHLTSGAKAFAERNDIEIWDKFSLEKYANDFTGNENKEVLETKSDTRQQMICDRCWGRFVKRTAKQGSNKGNTFLGCENYPRCKNIVNL